MFANTLTCIDLSLSDASRLLLPVFCTVTEETFLCGKNLLQQYVALN